jgi:hypothetical protein
MKVSCHKNIVTNTVPRKVLSDQSKILRTYEHKMAENALSHMLLKFFINRM